MVHALSDFSGISLGALKRLSCWKPFSSKR